MSVQFSSVTSLCMRLKTLTFSFSDAMTVAYTYLLSSIHTNANSEFV